MFLCEIVICFYKIFCIFIWFVDFDFCLSSHFCAKTEFLTFLTPWLQKTRKAVVVPNVSSFHFHSTTHLRNRFLIISEDQEKGLHFVIDCVPPKKLAVAHGVPVENPCARKCS